MRWIRYPKINKKTLNFLKFDIDYNIYCLIAGVKVGDKFHSLNLMSNADINHWQIYSVAEGRIPLIINRATTIENLALNSIMMNNRVTPHTAMNLILDTLTKDELLVNWRKGLVYYKAGRTTVKVARIEAYYIVEKRKLMKWQVVTEETEDEDNHNED